MTEERTDARELDDGATVVVEPDEASAADGAGPSPDAAGGDAGAPAGAPAGAQARRPAPGPAALSPLDELELPLEVRLGRLVQPLERVLSYKVGDAVEVGPDGDDLVTLHVQGRPYARGELVVVDGRFAFRLRELLGSNRGP